MELIKSLAFDHSKLASLEKQSYVSSLVHAMSRMKIDDEQVWASLAAYLVQRVDIFDHRDLSTQIYALAKVS